MSDAPSRLTTANLRSHHGFMIDSLIVHRAPQVRRIPYIYDVMTAGPPTRARTSKMKNVFFVFVGSVLGGAAVPV